MDNMRAVFLDLDTLDCGDLALSELVSSVSEWQSYGATQAQLTQARVQGADIVISNKVVLDEAVFEKTPSLQLVCVAATGYNNVDLDAANRYGVTVCNARGYSTPSVVQHVFALLLSLCRQLPQYQKTISDGRWQRSEQFCLLDFPMQELNGKTLGIIGYGALGKEVARLAECFGMRVLLAQRPGSAAQDRVPLHELLPQVDVLSLHCPLTLETKGLIGRAELGLMKSSALLINTARGGIVDEAALAQALCCGELAGAGIDVLAEEPPLASNPLLEKGIPNLIITPHTAWASVQARQRLVEELRLNIDAFQQGKPRNVV